jgi:predicted adenine nucleotide alpha hydrolase (AANH) superfamily ATPase
MCIGIYLNEAKTRAHTYLGRQVIGRQLLLCPSANFQQLSLLQMMRTTKNQKYIISYNWKKREGKDTRV